MNEKKQAELLRFYQAVITTPRTDLRSWKALLEQATEEKINALPEARRKQVIAIIKQLYLEDTTADIVFDTVSEE